MSVVIPAYNAGSYLAECLRSVHAQEGSFELEIIVVDDGSTDATASIARADEGVVLLRQPVNRGPSSARNQGVAAARGEFVAFIDADDLWPPDKLTSQLDVLQRHPAAAMVIGDCRQFDADGPRARTQFESGHLGAAAWGEGQTVPDAYRRLLDDNFITTGSVVARRHVLAESGGFAEDLRLVEDLDLWLRIARRYPVAWCAQVSLLRRRHDANLSRDPEAMALAFLEVLRRQAARDGTLEQDLARTLRSVRARELLHLSDLALGRADARDALRWALKALLSRPSARGAWRIGQAALACWGPKAPAQDRSTDPRG